MSRLAILLAAASVLGTGCIVSNDCSTRNVDVTWSSFRLYDNTVTTSCATAGVAYVDVIVGSSQPVRSYCGDGGVSLTGVPSGTITVEGIAADGSTILVRDQISIATSACGVQTVDTQPSEGTVRINFAVPGDQCVNSSYMWYRVDDQIAGGTAALETGYDLTRNSCDAGQGDHVPTPIQIVLATGDYSLRWIEEVVSPGTVYSANCTPVSFGVNPAQRTDLPVVLVDATAACPNAAIAPGRTPSSGSAAAVKAPDAAAATPAPRTLPPTR